MLDGNFDFSELGIARAYVENGTRKFMAPRDSKTEN
jgi:hypothetical protein